MEEMGREGTRGGKVILGGGDRSPPETRLEGGGGGSVVHWTCGKSQMP